MQESKKFTFDVSITLFASMISLPLGFITTFILGRYLGAEELGLYRMTSTVFGISLLFAEIGLPAAMIKFVAELKNDKDKLNQITSSGIITSLIGGLGFVALFYFSSNALAELFNMPRLSELLKIISLVFPFALLNGTLLGLLNGLREMKTHAIGMIIQSIIMVVITVTLIYSGFGVEGAVIGIILSKIGSCIYLIWMCKQYINITFDKYVQSTKKLLLFGVQLFGVNAINIINYHADTTMIGYFLTAGSVGYYGVAAIFSQFFWIIPQAVQRITYPATSEFLSKNNHKALQNMIDKSIKYTSCTLLLFGLGVGFFAKEIITVTFGEDFVVSVLPLQILAVGTVIYGINSAIGGCLSGAGRPDIAFKVVCISAITNILLNSVLIPRYGIAGAAVATAISLIVSAFIATFFTFKIVNMKFDFKWFGKISGITLLAILTFKWFEFMNVYALSTIILSFYLLAMNIFLFADDDKKFLGNIIKDVYSFFNTLIYFKKFKL